MINNKALKKTSVVYLTVYGKKLNIHNTSDVRYCCLRVSGDHPSNLKLTFNSSTAIMADDTVLKSTLIFRILKTKRL